MTEIIVQRRQTANESFISEREPLLPPEAEQLVEQRQQEILERPVQRIVAQIETFLDAYRGRTESVRYEWSNAIEEVHQFATRDAGCTQIDELYTVVDTYSPQLKSHHTRTYAVDLFVANKHQKVCITDQHKLTAYEFDADGEPRQLDEAQSQALLLDYDLRALVTEVRVANRTPEQEQAANDDALGKLQDLRTAIHHRLEQNPTAMSSPQRLLHDVYTHPELWSR